MDVIQLNDKTERLKNVNRSGKQILLIADGRIIDLFALKILSDKTKVFYS
ncbi:MAG: hypothetical protein K2I30_00760 [Clostridia bacterium]|nr:hypothetical protein [Clostridia bacterium]